MKKLWILFFLLLTLSLQGAVTVTLAWDPSPDATVTGYRIYYGIVTGLSTNVLDVGNVTICDVTNLLTGREYFFFATAYNSWQLESDPSNVITYTVPSENFAPVLINVPPQTAYVGRQLSFRIRASDVNAEQTICYSLTTNAPAGATINPVTGDFSWTPTQPGSYPVTVRATDNGTPVLSVSCTFIIQVPRRLSAPQIKFVIPP